MLIDRDGEFQRLAALIASARAGRGGAAVLRGDPGIGKTALIEWLREEAEGFQILASTGVESEAELAFAALADTLRPVLKLRTDIASPQRAALDTALALAPPAVADRFAAYAGAFALIEAAAQKRPLLITVDDAHWLDAPSAEAIAFVAHRLEDVPAVLVVALRPGEGQDLRLPGAEEFPLAALSDEAARRLLDAQPGEPVDSAVARRLLTVAAGNPLALIELPRALGLDERAGRAALSEPLRVGDVITRAFRRRLEGLDTEARRGLVVVAAGIEDSTDALLAACERLGCPVAGLERAEAAGILGIGPERIGFTHPLLRAVALEITPPAELREAHRVLADVIAAERGPERRAWHLALSSVGADEEAAQALEEAGMAAAARTAYATASDALVRSAGLTSDPDARAGRLLRAAGLAQMSGRFPLAAGLLEQGAATAIDPGLSAEIDHLRGLVRIYTGPMDEGIRLLFDSADAVAAHSPARAALMLVDSSMAWGMVGHPAMCIVACRRALQIGALDERGRAKLDLAMGNSLLFVGQGAVIRASAERLERASAGLDPVGPDHHAVVCGIIVQMYMGRFAAGWREVDRAVGACRASGALGPLAFYLAVAGDLAFRTPRWIEGLASAEEGFRIAEETGQIPIAAYTLCVLARLEGAQGREEGARAHLKTAAQLAAMSRTAALDVWGGHALGLLELGLGRHEEAIHALEPVAHLWEREAVRCPEAVPWQHDLVEAYMRSGRIADARRALRALAELAHASGGPQVLALTSRCRGLIDPEYERHFEQALALHAQLPIPFDEARTRLCYAERLRRARKRGRAREQLELSLAGFEALGARPWAERAREELAAAGAPALAPAPPTVEALSPRELQVALAVARGATNREAANALFLSEKTVERHLSAVYAKLGLRSRTELARRLAHEERPAG